MKAKDLASLVRLRVRLAPGIDLGPGKADLLEGILETGSISAAGRRMRMSYKRAWQLIDELNGLFDAPLVADEARTRRARALPAHARGVRRGGHGGLALPLRASVLVSRLIQVKAQGAPLSL